MKTALQQIHCILQNNPSYPPRLITGAGSTNPLHIHAAEWAPLLERYRKGDKTSLSQLCCKAQPLADRISRDSYFANALGQDEAYSIAAMTMVTFWSRIPSAADWNKLPGQLYNAMKCDLMNQIRRQKTYRSHEVHYETETEVNDDRQEPPADCRDEPENRLLQKEWNESVRDCLQYLGVKERKVIDGYFFRQLTVTEIALELHCSPDSVTSAKRAALKKLRKLFEEKQVA